MRSGSKTQLEMMTFRLVAAHSSNASIPFRTTPHHNTLQHTYLICPCVDQSALGVKERECGSANETELVGGRTNEREQRSSEEQEKGKASNGREIVRTCDSQSHRLTPFGAVILWVVVEAVGSHTELLIHNKTTHKSNTPSPLLLLPYVPSDRLESNSLCTNSLNRLICCFCSSVRCGAVRCGAVRRSDRCDWPSEHGSIGPPAPTPILF